MLIESLRWAAFLTAVENHEEATLEDIEDEVGKEATEGNVDEFIDAFAEYSASDSCDSEE